MKINYDFDLKPLVLAVVKQAARDASGGDEEAREWIASESIVWLDGVGANIHPDTIQRWMNKGCKIPARARQLMTA